MGINLSLERYGVVYIVGVGRSGTSLLQAMLAAHPEISYLPETSFIRRFVTSFKLKSVFKKKGRIGVLDILSADEPFSRLGIDPKLLISIFEDSENQDVSIYKAILNFYKSEGVAWLGDKDPRLVEYLPLVKKLLPNSNIIHIIRDPRDVLVSKKKAAWSMNSHVWKHVFANRVQFLLGTLTGSKYFSHRYQEVIYEDILNNPKTTLSTICGNMGIDFNENMLAFNKAAKKLISSTESSWKKETMGPLLVTNKNKWKYQLSPKEIELVQRCCGDALRRGQYELQEYKGDFSLTEKCWLICGELMIKLLSKPYVFYRLHKVKKTCANLN